MTYIGCFASAVIGLFLRSAPRGRVPDDAIFSMQIALFVVGGAAGAFFDVRQALRKRRRCNGIHVRYSDSVNCIHHYSASCPLPF